MLSRLEQLRISCAVMLIVGVGVTILAFRNLGGTAPQPPQLGTASSSQPNSPSRITGEDIERIFAAPSPEKVTVAQKEANPFYTEHYVPPPEPAPQAEPQPTPPPEPEPKTETVELTYRGFFETQTGTRKAYVLVGEALKTVVVGSNLIGAWQVKAIETKRMVLTSPGKDNDTNRQSLEIPFNRKQSIEIPKSS